MIVEPTIGSIALYYEGDQEVVNRRSDTSSFKLEKFHAYVRDHGERLPGRNGERFHAAIITKVGPGRLVNLQVFFADGIVEFRDNVCRVTKEFPEDGVHHRRNSGWLWPTDPKPVFSK